MGFLAYQFPGKSVKMAQGTWKNETLANLPEDCFFITDFTTEKSFYFVEQETVNTIRTENLSFNANNSVFAMDGKSYLNGLQFFIDGFDNVGIKKAVYSRIKIVERLQEDEIAVIFDRLAGKYKDEALVYLVSSPEFGTWIGATPEVLLSGNEEEMRTMALAGTKHGKQDQWTEKEEEEHAYVVDFIKEKLDDQSAENIKIQASKTVQAGAVFHLQTNFTFQLKKEHWNNLLQNIHPTPAVCGTPQKEAMNYILRLEPHEREFYSGMIGYKKKDELSVYVNLRCMQVLDKSFALYLGGGITSSSDVKKELQETEDKSETLLSVI